MPKASTGQASGWTLAFETLTVAAVLAFLLGVNVLWPEGLGSGRLIPRGTVLNIQLDDPVSSRTAHLGDRFYGRILSTQGSDTVGPTLVGARVVGRCVATRDGQGAGGPGYLRLALSGLIDSRGHVLPLDTSTVSFLGEQMMSTEVAAQFIRADNHGPGTDATESTRSSEDAVAGPNRQLSFVMLRAALVPRR
jgi:hypothetical protein